MKFLRRLIIFFMLIFLTLGLFAGWVAYDWYRYHSEEDQNIIVSKGMSVRSIARELEENGVIKNRYLFELLVRLRDVHLQVGEYAFQAGSDIETILDKMINGDVIRHQFTIPEGFSTKDIRKILIDKKLMSAPEFDQLVTRVDWLKDNNGVASLEGYLFPETYTYDAQSKPEELIRAMVTMFYNQFGDARMVKVAERGLTLHQLVTLASVVEKETGKANERPLIAGVFFNRLKLGMMLQSDPTVIYGIPNYRGNITKADLLRDTPYNTYTRTGLPVGPICSVGLAALDAVLNPAETKALYFVAKGDGSHYFSESLEEHNRAVQYYQLHRGSPP